MVERFGRIYRPDRSLASTLFVLTVSSVALFVAIVTASAIVQALTGFGFALCALGMLAFWMDMREAAILLCPAGLLVNAILFYRLRRHFRWEGLVPLLSASLVGLPLGTLLLLHTTPRTLEIILACLMIGAAVQGFANTRAKPVSRAWHPVLAGIPCGFFGGVLSGAFGTGGPPIVSFLINQKLDRFRYIASTQALLGLVSTVRCIQFVAMGRIGGEQLPLVLLSFGAVAIGTLLGLNLLRRFSDVSARRAVLWFLIVSAVGRLARG